MAEQARLTPAQVNQYKKLIEQTYAGILNAIDRLDSAVGFMSDARFKDQLALYKQQRDDRYTVQVQTVLAYPDADPFWADKKRMERFVAQLEAFIEQIKATTASAKVSFWDGFLDTLGERAAKIYEDLPSPLQWLKWAPWVIAGALVLPTLLRTFAGYKRGGAASAAEAAAEGIEATSRRVGEGAKSLARRASSGGFLRGSFVSPRRRSRR